MNILSNNPLITVKNELKCKNNNSTRLLFGNADLKISSLKADMVSFGNVNPLNTAESKMIKYVNEQLAGLKPDQPIKITTTKENLPVAKIMAKEAYKKGSGKVYVTVVEPELERLKAKYGGEDFKWKGLRKETLAKQGSMEINMGNKVNALKDAGLTQKEISAINEDYHITLPKDVVKLMEKFVEPKEILHGKLSLKPGQPLKIVAERQHEPLVNKLAEAAYQNGSKIVDVTYVEGGPNDFERSYTEHANEKVIMDVPEWTVPQFQEYLDSGTARLYLDGEDPNSLKGVSGERMELTSKGKVKLSKAIDFYRKDSSTPWCIYYAPTTKSAILAYPEVIKGDVPTRDEEVEALRLAAKDAVKINRVGTADAHYAKLEKIGEILNSKRYDEVHFVRKDKETGKLLTDLYVGLTPKSNFKAAREKTIPNKKGEIPQPYIANCPTEEVFTTPDKNKVRGFVTATLPLSMDGKIIEDIYVEFDKEGKIILDKIGASKNMEVFRDHIKNNEGADRLGEVALVAGSAIFDTGRVFYSTLLDENAACHIAIGKGYAECVDGASDQDPDKIDKYLEQNNCNESTTHIDFMIGSPDTVVEGIKFARDAEGKVVMKGNKPVIEEKETLIKDNAFKI